MFAARLNFASIRATRSAVGCSPSVNNRQAFSRQSSVDRKHLVFSRIIDKEAAATSIFAQNFSQTLKLPCGRWIRAFSTSAPDVTDAPSKADVFGDLGGRKFERVELDEDEKAEEKFVENEARVPRSKRLTPGGYASLIKSHIKKRDLNAALEVLELVKENRDKPTVYMYNLLLRAFAVTGNLKKCRSLYATMKKRELTCNAATYTSILNACANYHSAPAALEYLSLLREEFLEKNIALNATHYNAMIKAYGRHNQLLEAFNIADEMRDKRLPTDEVTFNSLLCGAISDREAGLRHALAVWHLMRLHKIKPTLTSYNLLLRAIRDTKLGDLRADDNIFGSLPEHRIRVSGEERTDLLSKPPMVSPMVIKGIGEKPEVNEDGETEDKMAGESEGVGERRPEMRAKKWEVIGEDKPEVRARKSEVIDEGKPEVGAKKWEGKPEVRAKESEAIGEGKPEFRAKKWEGKPEVRAKESEAIGEGKPEYRARKWEVIGEDKPEIAAKESETIGEDGSEITVNESNDLPTTVAADSETSLTSEEKRMIGYPLEKIHRKNRLILFGGLTGILERMANDGVTPDTKTITLLMELVPKTAAAENNIIRLARAKGIDLDIDFFNMLMKKRTLRKDYAGAKEVLDDIQRCGLCPDVITWGIMAMGCQNSQEARELIEGMRMTGHRLNTVIAGTLINVACRKIRFGFILEIMDLMKRMSIKPNYELYTALDAFKQEMEQMIKSGKFSRTVNHPDFKAGFSKFCMRYPQWQEEMGRKIEKKGRKT